MHAVVIGDPGAPLLMAAEAHLRDLHATDYGAAALRQLRAVAERLGCHPMLDFGAGVAAVPVISMPPEAPAMQQPTAGSPGHEALRAAVAEGARAQLRLLCTSFFGTPASNAPTAPSAATDAGGPIRRPRLRARQASNRVIRFAPPRPAGHAASQRGAPPPPLGAIVEQWIGLANPELTARWRDIAAAGEQSAVAAFDSFLHTLTFSHIHAAPATRVEVARWLEQAAQPGREELRAEAFRICDEGTNMCRDNALLTWNRLKMLMLKEDVLAGKYAGELPIICKLGLDTLRMDMIEAIAQDKIIALHKLNRERLQQRHVLMPRQAWPLQPVRPPEPGQPGQPAQDAASVQIPFDPIEIMLDYHVSLLKELDLPLSVQEMNFPSLSPITREDISRARDAIRNIEQQWFHEYLMLDFAPFLLEVRRQMDPRQCAEAEAELHAGLDGLEERLVERLDAVGASGNEQARLNMGVRLGRELRYNTWLPHANAALARAGLAPLPPMNMSSVELRPWAVHNP
ncbi:hypothetical protein CAL12_12530 [Bordetella genomosp. 8]|uniref:NEL domain-containing protein n=1 Tax=Bordetella genomosp. 8 TaxID=1416806 RepID=A0A1W6YKE4_9BORD|nr:hypothetical protein CAL12_12530 [Bordetella genomosp. 8]